MLPPQAHFIKGTAKVVTGNTSYAERETIKAWFQEERDRSSEIRFVVNIRILNEGALTCMSVHMCASDIIIHVRRSLHRH